MAQRRAKQREPKKKKEVIEVEGVVRDALPNAQFDVELPNGAARIFAQDSQLWVGQGGRGDDVRLSVSDLTLPGQDCGMSLVQDRKKFGFGDDRGW